MPSLSSQLGLLSLGVWLACFGCGKSGDNDANVAGAGASGGAGAGAGTAGAPVVLIVPEIMSAGAGGLPVPPAIDCGQPGGDSAGAGGDSAGAGGDSAGAGGAIEECGSPPSVCADGQRLLYYSSGVCVAGACTWTVETLECPDVCRHGSCQSSTTEK